MSEKVLGKNFTEENDDHQDIQYPCGRLVGLDPGTAPGQERQGTGKKDTQKQPAGNKESS